MDKTVLPEVLPRHIGIIMDGNGRWAKLRGLERWEGHKKGAEAFRRITTYASDIGLEFLTFYAFSTENWSRPEREVSAIMDIFRDFLVEAEDRRAENAERGFRVRFIGDSEGLPADIQDMADRLESISGERTKTTINIAVNYGGRAEILHAVKGICEDISAGRLSADELDEKALASHLYTASMPDPDLIIRPSGEYRLSNFLIWQSAYSEFWFSDILWPDFTPEDLNRAINDYAKRSRRFGGV